jgi:hypothetical protein
MKVTPESLKQNDADFAAAFDEDAPAPVEQTEDEAFGITPDAPHGEQPAAEEEAAETPAEEAAESDAAVDGEPAGETAAEAAGDAPGDDGEVRDTTDMQGEAGEAPTNESTTEGPVDIEKETQRLKSWEGRLRKIEADLKAKADAAAASKGVESNGPVNDGTNTESQTADAIEGVADKADANGDGAMAEAAHEAADKVESGEMTPEQAMKQLAEDFGEDFVRMIEVIAKSHAMAAGANAATEKVGQVSKAVDDIIAAISDDKARTHFEKIHDAHPDFMEIGKSQGFTDYIASLPEAEQAEAKRVAERGSARDIIKLIGAYKASQKDETPEEVAAEEKPAADPVVDAQMDAAEGVRSSGMQLPTEPKVGGDSYEDAWKEFS